MTLPSQDVVEGWTRIVFARHGRTCFNVESRFRGRADPPLDEVGSEQAHLLGGSVVGLRARAVYSSPRRRAQETAAAIGAALHLPTAVLGYVDDIDYGRWTGRTAEEVGEENPGDYATWLSAPERLRLPEGESVLEAQSRLWTALLDLFERYRGETAVVVTHDICVRLLTCRALEAPLRAMHAIRVDVASTSAFEHRDGVTRLSWLNATSHLAPVTMPVSIDARLR